MSLLAKAWKILKTEGTVVFMSRTIDYFKWRIDSLIPYRSNFRISQLYFLLSGKIVTRSQENIFVNDKIRHKVWKLPGLRALFHVKSSYRHRITEQFFDNKFIQVSEDDVIVETGAYIGASTIGAAELADTVYAIEPSPRNRECLDYNTEEIDNIHTIGIAAWSESGTVEFNYGTAPDDDSILSPDKGSLGQTVEVPADTIKNIASEYNIGKLIF